jgi:hypothetical protein
MPVVTINLNVEETMLEKAGENTFKDFVEEQVENYKMRLLCVEIKDAVERSGIDLEKELKAAKKRAWEKYKDENLRGLIK